MALARYNADGTLDTDFGSYGQLIVRVNSTSTEEAFAVALQPDGKIIVGGYSVVNGRNYFSLARFNEDGSPDFGFGVFGKVTTESTFGAIAYSVNMQSDGKTVAVGSNLSTYHLFALARYEN